MMASKSPSRPNTASMSAAGIGQRHLGREGDLCAGAEHQAHAPADFPVRTGVSPHPGHRFPGGGLELVRRRQHGDVVHAHRRREPCLGVGHPAKICRRLQEPLLCFEFLVHDDLSGSDQRRTTVVRRNGSSRDSDDRRRSIGPFVPCRDNPPTTPNERSDPTPVRAPTNPLNARRTADDTTGAARPPWDGSFPEKREFGRRRRRGTYDGPRTARKRPGAGFGTLTKAEIQGDFALVALSPPPGRLRPGQPTGTQPHSPVPRSPSQSQWR